MHEQDETSEELADAIEKLLLSPPPVVDLSIEPLV